MRVLISRKFAKASLRAMMLLAISLCVMSFTLPLFAPLLGQVFPFLTFYNLEDGIRTLDVNEENSVPTWFSSSLLLLCSVLLVAIASAAKRLGERDALWWAALSVIFVLLSLDETASFHESATELLRSLLHTGGLLYYAWVIPGGACVFVFGLAYLGFLFRLPTKTRWLFIASGALYVSGALGSEMLNGLWASLHGESNLTYSALVTVEEFLEMSGAILFLYALMLYAGNLQELRKGG